MSADVSISVPAQEEYTLWYLAVHFLLKPLVSAALLTYK